MNKLFKGIQLALLTAFISGFSIFINKFAVDSIKPALTFTASKNIMVAVMIISLLIITKKWRQILSLKKDQAIKLFIIAVIGGSLPFYLFFTGLSQTSAINAAILQKTLVIWVAIIAIPFLKEKLSAVQILAIGVLFGSNIMIGGFRGFSYSQGELMILAATILWAIETVIAKRVLNKVDADIVTGARMGIGSLILFSLSLITNPKTISSIVSLNSNQWFWLLLTALSLFAYVSIWYRSLKLAPATTVTAVLVISTLVTNLLSAIFISHSWKLQLTQQGILMILGISLLIWQIKNNQNNAELAK